MPVLALGERGIKRHPDRAGHLELARIGSQLFVFGQATYDQTAVKRLFDTFTIRLSAQPLSKKNRIRRFAEGAECRRVRVQLGRSVAGELPDRD